MNTVDIVNEIGSRFFPVRMGKGLIKSQINSIIDRINVEMGSRVAILTITSGETVTNWDDDTGDWDVDDGDWGSLTVTTGWEYDSTAYSITAPTDIEKIEKIWIDDEEWSARTFQEIKDSGNSSAEIFYSAGRYIYFPADVSSKELKVQVRVNYAYLTDSIITLPDNYRSVIVSGSIYMLSAMAEYENKILLSVHGAIYNKHIDILKTKKNMLEIPQDTVREYCYQGITAGRK